MQSETDQLRWRLAPTHIGRQSGDHVDQIRQIVSSGETHLWIVDYKTARHGTSGIDAFLQSEKEKYLQQLEAYAGIMRKVHGENLPLRLALYYPLLARLVWWGPQD